MQELQLPECMHLDGKHKHMPMHVLSLITGGWHLCAKGCDPKNAHALFDYNDHIFDPKTCRSYVQSALYPCPSVSTLPFADIFA